MSNIGTPAYRPTADCIWNSFRSSGKQKLVLFGENDLGLLSELTEKNAPVLAADRRDALALSSRSDVFFVDLDAPFGNTGCVIMASGLGIRFGGNKLLADFRGEPLIGRVLNQTEGIFTRRVVVTRHREVADFCEVRGVRAVLHDLPRRSDTIRLGLETVGDAERCVFCPGDQPLLRAETVAALVLAGINGPESIWRTRYEDAYGAPVLFPRGLFSELKNLPDGKGGRFVIKKYPERLRSVSARDRYELMDVDTPEDLAILVGR